MLRGPQGAHSQMIMNIPQFTRSSLSAEDPNVCHSTGGESNPTDNPLYVTILKGVTQGWCKD